MPLVIWTGKIVNDEKKSSIYIYNIYKMSLHFNKIFFQKIFIYNTIHCLVILPTGQVAAGQPQNVECKSVYLTLRRW